MGSMEERRNVGFVGLRCKHRCKDELCKINQHDQRDLLRFYEESHFVFLAETLNLKSLELIVKWCHVGNQIISNKLEDELYQKIESFLFQELKLVPFEKVVFPKQLGDFEIGFWMMGAEEKEGNCKKLDKFTQDVCVSIGMLSEFKTYLQNLCNNLKTNSLFETVISEPVISLELDYPFGIHQIQTAKNVQGFTRLQIYYLILWAVKKLYDEELNSSSCFETFEIKKLFYSIDKEKGSISQEEKGFLNQHFGLPFDSKRPLTNGVHKIHGTYFYDLYLTSIMYDSKTCKLSARLS